MKQLRTVLVCLCLALSFHVYVQQNECQVNLANVAQALKNKNDDDKANNQNRNTTQITDLTVHENAKQKMIDQSRHVKNNAIPEYGIEFNCDDFNNSKGHYWPKTDTASAFAYIDHDLYKNIIESKDKPEKEPACYYLGHFINEESETIYLYADKDTTEEIADDDHDDENEN